MSDYSPLEGRWMQFKRFGEERVLQIHVAERAAGCTSLDSRCTAPRVLIDRFNGELGAFWSAKKTESERTREILAFRIHVAPIWKAVATAGRAAGLSEIQMLHEADLAIVRDQYKINYTAGASVSSSAILSKVYDKSGQDRAAGADAEE